MKSAAPTNPKSSDLKNYLPNANAIANEWGHQPGQPISLGVYDRANKLPYTINYTLDVQWQPRNDLAIELGYVGNLGRHQVIPVPFNQPNIASPSSPILKGGALSAELHLRVHRQRTELRPSAAVGRRQATIIANYEGGNVDLRVPYIGYAAESIDYKIVGCLSLQRPSGPHRKAHEPRRPGRVLSYTYSHALDEQSGLGLFYNGNNPLNLRDGYASADFDRTHVINFNYVYRLPDFGSKYSIKGDLTNGWSVVGLTVLQSGQPYSVIDFTQAP